MKNLVKIVANKNTDEVVTERIITDKAGVQRTVGVIMVQSKALASLSSLGRVATRTAFITLEQDAIEFLADELVDGAEFPVSGKIVVVETTVPYVSSKGKKQEPKINPTTGVVMTFQGKPVYRNSFFSENVNEADIFLTEVKGMSDMDAHGESPE
jgi:hypothetical protein